MDFSLNDDHLALRDAVRRFCDGEYKLEHRGNPETPEQATRRWSGMAELGLLGLPFPEAMGGSGQGPVEVMVVAQELGRALGGAAFVASTVLAGELLWRLGSPAQQRRWLPDLASGTVQAGVALYEDGVRYDWRRLQMQARPSGDGYVLNGRKTGVLHGDSAGLLLVVARAGVPGAPGDGLAVFLVDAQAPGVQVHGFDTLDGRRAAHVTLADVHVGAERVLGVPGAAGEAVEAALDAAVAALCAEAVGVTEVLIEHTAEHLRTRRQFGAPLAKFQVLQHRLADMVIALEQLKSMACAAAMAVEADEPVQRRRLVSAAKVLVSQQGRQLGLSAIQMHGAMGMTDECRVGHCTKRLMVIGQLFGDASWHLQSLVAITSGQAA